MPIPKQVIIQGEVFLRGKSECLCCGHKFKFLLPVFMLSIWEQMCSTCTTSLPDPAPKKGEIAIEIMGWYA